MFELYAYFSLLSLPFSLKVVSLNSLKLLCIHGIATKGVCFSWHKFRWILWFKEFYAWNLICMVFRVKWTKGIKSNTWKINQIFLLWVAFSNTFIKTSLYRPFVQWNVHNLNRKKTINEIGKLFSYRQSHLNFPSSIHLWQLISTDIRRFF